MIDKGYGKIQVQCDNCGVSVSDTYDNEDFSIMIADIKRDDWNISKLKDEWIHTCSDCRN